MAEYKASEPREIKPGEPIEFVNNCKSSFRVGTGIMFESDGEYHVSVNGNRISVQGYYPPNVRPVVRGDAEGNGMNNEYVYVVRYYDYYNDQTVIDGVYKTWSEVAAEIVDSYDGHFDYADLKEPEPSEWGSGRWDIRDIEIDGGDRGKCLIIEKVKVG